MHRGAFSLVELLVVVTIIVILIALLTPSLDRAIDAAERSVCASRLHAWGIAHGAYWLDSRRRLMSSVRFDTSTSWPNIIWAGSASKGGQFALDPIRPYIQGVTQVGVNNGMPVLTIGGPWYCPATKLTAEKDAYNTKRVERRKGDGTGDDAFVEVAEAEYASGQLVPPFLIPDYTYYGRIDQWSSLATHPDRLTGRSLEPGRLLMADALTYTTSFGYWSYNHGPQGYSYYSDKLGGPNQTGVPIFSGVNRLTGDGATFWRPAETFDPEAMLAGDDDAPHTGNSGWNFY